MRVPIRSEKIAAGDEDIECMRSWSGFLIVLEGRVCESERLRVGNTGGGE